MGFEQLVELLDGKSVAGAAVVIAHGPRAATCKHLEHRVGAGARDFVGGAVGGDGNCLCELEGELLVLEGTA
eukprot:1434705-Rhodomonas_salina.2